MNMVPTMAFTFNAIIILWYNYTVLITINSITLKENKV